MNEMLTKSPEISERPKMLSPVAEMQGYMLAEVAAKQAQRGRKQAIADVAREHGMPARRVLAILRAEIGRVWADEMDRARQVYRDFLAREEQRSLARANELAAERARLDAQDAQDGLR